MGLLMMVLAGGQPNTARAQEPFSQDKLDAALAQVPFTPDPQPVALQAGLWEQTYRVFFVGLDVGKVRVELHFMPDGRYYAVMSGGSQTAGVLRFFVSWSFELHAFGRYTPNGRLTPEAYSTKTLLRGKTYTTKAVYKPDGNIMAYRISPQPQRKDMPRLSEDRFVRLMSQGNWYPRAKDSMFWVFEAIFQGNRTGDCTFDMESLFVVDGPVRINLEARGREQIDAVSASPYAGEAMVCRMYGSAAWLDDADYQRAIYDNLVPEDVARMHVLRLPDSPVSYVPVRLRYDTSYGPLKVFLADQTWTLGGPVIDDARWQAARDQIREDVAACANAAAVGAKIGNVDVVDGSC